MSDPVVTVEDVSKRFRMYRERNQSLKAALMRGKRASFDEFWALRDVSFEIEQGSTFGLIGENGSGKSTLLKCIARILQPNQGRIRTRGRLAALLELGSGFHPELSGRENVFLNGSILGLSRKELARKFDEIVDFSGIETFIDQPVKNYSSGMYVRLGFAIAINVDPEILLVDEVLAVGDSAFQAKCMEKFAEYRRSGKTVVVVSHAMGTMRTMCDAAAWLDHGRLVEVGPIGSTVDDYVDAHSPQRVEQIELAEGGTAEQTRVGTGEAVITKVEILDATGRPATAFHSRDALTIRVHYDARERIAKPVFGLAIDVLDGYRLWGFHSRDGEFVPDAIAGRGSIDMSVPSLMLQPGTFDVTASIVDHSTTHQFDFVRNVARFDVLDSGLPRESGGVVFLGGRWGNLQQGPDADEVSGATATRGTWG